MPVPLIGGGEQAARLRADLAAAGIDRRHELVAVDPPDVLACSTSTGWTSCRWAAPRRRTPCCSRRPPPPGALAADRVRRPVGVMADRLERLTNLVATLLDTRRPLTLEEIVERVGPATRRQAPYRRQFERDKETLREIGIPISLETVDALGHEWATGSTPTDYYLPPLDLDRRGAGGAPRGSDRGAPRGRGRPRRRSAQARRPRGRGRRRALAALRR